MKKTLQIVAGIALSLFSLTAMAQDTTKTTTNTWDPKSNPTVAALTAPYKDKMVGTRPALTNEAIFPAIGAYTSTTSSDASSVTIRLDAENKGLVWIEGLPQGRVKAMLRKSPSTYKIPAQKTEDGKDIAEGTLIYDKDANTLNIVIGKAFNPADPGAAFVTPAEPVVTEEPVVKTKPGKTKIKTKKVVEPKPWTYTGSKVVTTTASN